MKNTVPLAKQLRDNMMAEKVSTDTKIELSLIMYMISEVSAKGSFKLVTSISISENAKKVLRQEGFSINTALHMSPHHYIIEW